MAAHRGRFTSLLSTTDVQANGTAAKTVLQIVAGTGIKAKITNLSISSTGATATTYYKVRILRQTTAGTMGGGAGTITTLNAADTQAFLTTTQVATASGANGGEPSAGDVLMTFILPSVNGYWERDFNNSELVTGYAGRIGVEVTASAADTNLIRVSGELEE